ncbi:MAG: KEOPS complex subunit Cgi121 [Thermoprotei archaeon]
MLTVRTNGLIVLIQGIKVRSPININSLKKILEKANSNNYVIQLIDADIVASLHHLIAAIIRTERSFHSKRNISHKKHVELLLRLCGTRQISDAIKIAGIKPDSVNVILICYGKTECPHVKTILNMIDGDLENNILYLNKEKRNKLIKIYNLPSSISDEDLIKYVLFKTSLIEIES